MTTTISTSTTVNNVQEACSFITNNGTTWQRIEITNCPLSGGGRDLEGEGGGGGCEGGCEVGGAGGVGEGGGGRTRETTAVDAIPGHVTAQKGVVRVSGLRLTEAGLCRLLEASLECGPAELRIDHVTVGLAACELIAKRLETHTTLLSLALTDCQLTDGGLQLIAQALRVDRSLGSLDVSDNRITSAGALALYRAMPAEPTLRSLDLSDNPCSGEAVRLLERVIKYFTCTFTEED